MATTLNLPFVRFVAQVSTGAPRPKSTFIALMEENLEALKACQWRRADSADAALVRHDLSAASYFSDSYDAFKMTAGWNTATESETAFAGMAAYRFKIPASAVSGAIAIASVALPVSRDRYLLGGVRIAAQLSDSATPSADWAAVRGEGGASASAYLANAASYLTASQPASGAVEFSAADAQSLAQTGKAYLWIYVTLENYTDWWSRYSAKEDRRYAIEGSAMLAGGSAAVTFAADVTPDPESSRTLVSASALPRLTGDATGICATMRLGNGDAVPFEGTPPDVAAADSAAGLNACYADLLLGRMTPVPPALLAGLASGRPGAGFTVLYGDVPLPGAQLGESVLAKAWTLAASAMVVPLVLSGPASNLSLAWTVPQVSGATLRAWLVAGSYIEDPTEEQLSRPSIYTAAGSPPDGWTLLGSAPVAAGTAMFQLPPLGLPQLATLVITAWLPPEEVALAADTPQGAGELAANMPEGRVDGLATLVQPTITIS